MRISHREMRQEDVAECAAIIAAHPVIGPRYGKQIGNLGAAWARLLRCEAKCATVFQLGGSRTPICCVGVTVFVSDEFVRELKAQPVFWTGPELMKRILGRNSPVLSDRKLREDNSRGGLNLVTWEGCIRPGFETNPEVSRHAIDRFVEEHSGFLLKEAISSQVESVERLRWTLRTGGMLWDPMSGCYETSFKKAPQEIIEEPHLLGVARDVELARTEAWGSSQVGALFEYHPPQLRFSRGEQKLLLAALSGATDPDLAADLEVSVSTVKNTWRSIYNRVASSRAEIIPDRSHAEESASDRGKEKRRYLLAYLRNHLEELRPVSQKLLQHAKNHSHARSDSSASR